MSNWAIEVRVAHAYCSLSLVSCFKIYELCLKLGTIDPIWYGSHTPPSHTPPIYPISGALSPVNCDTPPLPESTDRGRKRRATHGEPSVYYRERTNRYEPKLKARRAGETRMTDIWLGDYPSRQIAADVFRVAAFYYGRWDRLNHEYILWCEASLPPIPPQLSDEKKATWIREEAEDNANKISTLLGAPGPAVLPPGPHGQDSPLPEADPFRYSSSFPHVEHLEEGHDGVPVISETGAGGSCLNLWDPRLAEPCGEFLFQSSTCTVMAETSRMRTLTTPDDICRPEDIHMGLPGMDRDRDHSNTIDIDSDLNSEELYFDHSFFQTGSREGELELGSGQGVASDGLILLQTCGNQASCHQQDVQDLEQSHGSVFLLECGDVVGESRAEHPANQPQPINPPIIAQHSQEFEFTDTIRSTFQELRGQGWDFKVQPRISTKFSVPFSGCEGPLFTATNYLAFEEIHEQGFKLILEPNNNASFKDANEASPSGYGSRDRCRSCNAPL